MLVQPMKKHYIVSLFVLMLSAVLADAAQPRKDKVRFVYDVTFDMNFDNREYYRSGFSESMTIFGARLTPSVGVDVLSYDGTEHRVMMGIDVMKDFGASPLPSSIAGGETDETSPRLNNLALLREMTLYYRMKKEIGRTEMTMYAGIFPRSASEGRYSQAFFSDSLKFYDNNLEGILLKFQRPKAYFEVGCDWMGQFGNDRREKFMVYSAGEGKVAPVLSFGYAAYMYHFASCESVHGVVDNILVNPYMRFDFSRMMGLRTFAMRFGWLQGMQNDRRNIGIYTFPYGGEFDLEIRHWGFGIRNSLFYGMDMMPYYNNSDGADIKYGNRLYFGDPFYRVHDDGEAGAGMYDRLEVFWESYRSRFLNVHVGALFHFHDFHYSGCQQVVKLGFNLQELVNRKR